VIEARKFAKENGKFYYFDYDYTNQKYKDPSIISLNQVKKQGHEACDNPRLQLRVGYSYLKTGKSGPQSGFPLGIDLGIGFRLTKNSRFVFDVSGHSSQKTDQSFLKVFATGGIEFKRENCEKQSPISVFSRIAIGMMHDRLKNGGSKASAGSAAVANAGGGFDLTISPRMAVRLSGDYMIAFVNGDPQHNYRFGAGLNISPGNNK
jgi:hypothetical protein